MTRSRFDEQWTIIERERRLSTPDERCARRLATGLDRLYLELEAAGVPYDRAIEVVAEVLREFEAEPCL